ncbi:hypothetical protein [Pseudothermotoga sp.]|uniref:hypothetical protein n=1 Tax=Pseudothermotoga sp. TaxID=2033661 RepID=UPI0031F62710
MIILILSALFSCVSVQNEASEENLRYIVLAYRFGYGLSKEELAQIAERTTYDDEVLMYYEYFKTGKLSKISIVKAPQIYDERILNVIKSNLSANGTSSIKLIDLFDELLPKAEWNLDPDQTSPELTEKVQKLLINDWNNKGFFYEWCKRFSIEVSLEDLKSYAEFLVNACYSISKLKLSRTSSVQSGFFVQKVDLSIVPSELMLAICYVESKLFPAAFRAEIKNDVVQAVSVGLGQTLADADSLSRESDIGNGVKDLYTFELLNFHYFDNSFNCVELSQLRAGLLFCGTLLALIWLNLS